MNKKKNPRFLSIVFEVFVFSFWNFFLVFYQCCILVLSARHEEGNVEVRVPKNPNQKYRKKMRRKKMMKMFQIMS